MTELRKDYILDRYVIISEVRGKRPIEFAKEKINRKGLCVFCPGNESMTPNEVDRIEKDGKWEIRVVPNKFPIVTEEGDFDIKTENKFFTFSSGFGAHEVLIETDDHKKQMRDLSVSQINDVLNMYVRRIKALGEIKGVKYVLVFKNHGDEAGTSLVHSHSQIIAYNKIPSLVQDEVEAAKKFDSCPYCDIINVEKNSLRAVFEDDSFVSFTPYASRFPFEIWLFPKRHVCSIVDLIDYELVSLSAMLKKVLLRLKTMNAPYNFYIHNAPEGDDLHFHIEIVPRLTLRAGFEFGSNDIVNIVSPETAAKFYKEEI